MNQNGGIHKGGFAVLCHRNGGSESPGILTSLLSEWLNITPRSCNRIIQKLCLAGLLTQMHTEGPMEKGRPVKTYCFNEKACLSTFF